MDLEQLELAISKVLSNNLFVIDDGMIDSIMDLVVEYVDNIEAPRF